MSERNDNLPSEIKDGLFSRIKKFILKIFKRENKDVVYNTEENSNYQKDTDFIENIKVIDEFEEEKKIKYKLDNNKITIDELNDNEITRMIEFYKKEVERKKEKLNQINQRILKLKNA